MMKPRTCLARYSPFIVAYPTTHRRTQRRKRPRLFAALRFRSPLPYSN
jgi:hypothetical protein